MRSFRGFAILFCTLTILLPLGLVAQQGGPPPNQGAKQRGAQQQQQPDLPKATLRGHVFSLETGRPLKNAEITLRMDRGRSQSNTMTDNQGAFEFREVEPGSYTLECSHSGYVPFSYGQKDPRVPAPSITVNPGQTRNDLDFQLSRGGVISGKVLDEDGEPLAEVEVATFVRRYIGRRVAYVPTSSGTTDDRGAYRIYDLSPGKYLVMASYRTDAERSDGYRYRSVVFPATTSLGEGQRIDVSNGGEVSGIDFQLRPSPTFVLSGRVVDSSTGQVAAGGRVSLGNGDGVRGGSSGQIQRDGSFTVRGLFPGRYQMTIMGQGGGGGGNISVIIDGAPGGGRSVGMGSGRTTKVFDMPAGDVKGYVATIDHPETVRGKIVVETGQFTARGARVSLTPRNEQSPGAPAGQINDDLTFEIQNVPPGEYNVNIASRGAAGTPSAPFYIREVRVNNQDVSDGGLVVAAGAVGQVEVVLDFTGGAVTGRILDDKDLPVIGSVILVTSDEKKRADDRYSRTGNSDQNGQFSFTAVVPGDYLLLAWPDSEVGRVNDPEVFAEVEKYATRVHVDKNGSVAQELRLLGEVRLVAQNSR
jgi:uncharacterized GH25 family protein